MNFDLTEDEIKGIKTQKGELKEAPKGKFIVQSKVGIYTILKAKESNKYGKGISFDLENESGQTAKFVLIQYEDTKGKVSDIKVRNIKEIVHFTGKEFKGNNYKAFEGKKIGLALKVVEGSKDFPTVYISAVFNPETRKSLMEEIQEFDGTKSWEYWESQFEDHEEIKIKQSDEYKKKASAKKGKTDKADKFSTKPKQVANNINEDDADFPF